jgi:signal peptidase II
MPESIRRKGYQSLIFLAAAAVVAASDQASKAWTMDALAPHPGRAVSLIPRLLCFQYAQNTGAAFSLFDTYPAVLTVVAMVLALGVLAWSLLLPDREKTSRVALGLVFGGAVGNLIDRFTHGFVVDFIQIHWDSRRLWPTFNIADSAICVGIGLFVLSSWFLSRRSEKTPTPAGPAS